MKNFLFPGDGRMPIGSAETEPRVSPLGAGLWPSRSLSRKERLALENAALPSRSVNAHSDLVIERERADSLLLIEAGWACRYTMTGGGGRQLLALLVPGDLCNLDSLLLDRLDYGIRTLTPAKIVTLPRDRALALATEHAGIARMFAWSALVQNATLGKWALAVGRRPAKERLAHLLCELSARLGIERDDKSSFDFPITQEQIADALGLTPIHVNRMLKILRSEGLIALRNRRMTIQSVARLRRVGGFDRFYLHIERDGVASASDLVRHTK